MYSPAKRGDSWRTTGEEFLVTNQHRVIRVLGGAVELAGQAYSRWALLLPARRLLLLLKLLGLSRGCAAA